MNPCFSPRQSLPLLPRRLSFYRNFLIRKQNRKQGGKYETEQHKKATREAGRGQSTNEHSSILFHSIPSRPVSIHFDTCFLSLLIILVARGDQVGRTGLLGRRAPRVPALQLFLRDLLKKLLGERTQE